MSEDVSAWTKVGIMKMEDGVWMQKFSCEPTPQGRLVRSMGLWFLCHLLGSPLKQGRGTVPALPLPLCLNMFSPIHLTSSLKGAAPLVPSLSQQQEGNRLQLALWERARESSGGGLHRKDLNKVGSRFRTAAGRSSWSWVNCDHFLSCLPQLFALWAVEAAPSLPQRQTGRDVQL